MEFKNLNLREKEGSRNFFWIFSMKKRFVPGRVEIRTG
jgi:hypothetical protein